MPEYFIYKRQGPYGIKTLSQLVQNGEVDNSSFVWTPGMKSLEYAKKMAELKPWFEEQELKTEKVKIEGSPYASAQSFSAPQALVSPQFAGYKVAVNGQSTGPFSIEQLVERIQAGAMSPQTLVWKPGMTQWAPAQNVEDFAKVFAKTPVAVEQPVAADASASSPVTSSSPTQTAMDAPESDDFSPADVSFGEDVPEQALPETVDAETASPSQQLSLLQERDADVLPLTRFILPGVLILLGGAVTFLAMKTAVLAAPLAKLASLLARFTKTPIGGEQGKALAEGVAQTVPLLVKLIPGGLIVLAGIIVLVVTVLNRQSSEQFEPEQL